MSVEDGRSYQTARMYFQGMDHKAAFYDDAFVHNFVKCPAEGSVEEHPRCSSNPYYNNPRSRYHNYNWFHKFFDDECFRVNNLVVYPKQKVIRKFHAPDIYFYRLDQEATFEDPVWNDETYSLEDDGYYQSPMSVEYDRAQYDYVTQKYSIEGFSQADLPITEFTDDYIYDWNPRGTGLPKDPTQYYNRKPCMVSKDGRIYYRDDYGWWENIRNTLEENTTRFYKVGKFVRLSTGNSIHRTDPSEFVWLGNWVIYCVLGQQYESWSEQTYLCCVRAFNRNFALRSSEGIDGLIPIRVNGTITYDNITDHGMWGILMVMAFYSSVDYITYTYVYTDFKSGYTDSNNYPKSFNVLNETFPRYGDYKPERFMTINDKTLSLSYAKTSSVGNDRYDTIQIHELVLSGDALTSFTVTKNLLGSLTVLFDNAQGPVYWQLSGKVADTIIFFKGYYYAYNYYTVAEEISGHYVQDEGIRIYKSQNLSSWTLVKSIRINKDEGLEIPDVDGPDEGSSITIEYLALTNNRSDTFFTHYNLGMKAFDGKCYKNGDSSKPVENEYIICVGRVRETEDNYTYTVNYPIFFDNPLLEVNDKTFYVDVFLTTDHEPSQSETEKDIHDFYVSREGE